MVLEYLEGTDLAAVLKQRGPLPIDEAVSYVFEACEAVDEAHALGIVHRDLKPGNLFLARRPRGKPSVKVLDFGISSVATGEADVRLTGTGAVMGTPRYMAPEQMLDAHRADQRSDIWALGVILYELLTGGPPFPGNTFGLIHERMLTTEAESLRRRRPDVPAELDAAILRCLRKPQAERFQSIAELEQALRPFLVPVPVGAAPGPIVFGPPPPAVAPPAELVVSMLDRTGAATTGVMRSPTVPGAPLAPAPVPVTLGPPTTPMSWNHAGAVAASPPPSRKAPVLAIVGAFTALSALVFVALLVRALGSSASSEARPAATSIEAAPLPSSPVLPTSALPPAPSASVSSSASPPAPAALPPLVLPKPAARSAQDLPSKPVAPKPPAKAGIAESR
jgi:serine/threonine-protein kinase